MPTYDPNSVTLTIGGQRFEGVTSVEYRERPSQPVVMPRVRGSIVVTLPGNIEMVRAILGYSTPGEARARRIAKLRASLAALIAEPYPDLP